MPDDLAIIAKFPTPTEAYLAKAKLEAEGIESMVLDDNIVATDWLYRDLVGQVKLQVRQDDAAKAKAILARQEQPLTEDLAPEDYAELDPEGPEAEEVSNLAEAETTPAVTCPQCGCEDVTYEKYNHGLFWWTILLIRAPLPWPKRQWTCKQCGYTWKAGQK